MGVTDGSGLESVGAYVPRYGISAETIGEAWDGFRARGVSEKRVPAGDEDAVTMAIEAIRAALSDSEYGREAVRALALGTTTPPIDEGDVGARLAGIVGLDSSIEVSVHTQSARAGTRTLVDALRAEGPALAVAADCPRGRPGDAVDHAAGAGAVAAVVADAPGAPAEITDVASYAAAYPGTRFRQRGSDAVETYDATAYERDAYASVAGGAVAELDAAPDALAPTAPDGSTPSRAARAVGGAEAYHLADRLGDVGAASPLFGLLAAWEAGEESVAVVGFGAGAGADALAVEGRLAVDWDRPVEEIGYPEYLRKRGYVGPEGKGGER